MAPIVVGITFGGTAVRFSSPAPIFRKVSMVSVVGAPGICATVRTLPTRSTTAIVAGLPRAFASLVAWSTIVLTLFSVRLRLVPVLVGSGAAAGEEAGLPVLLPVPPSPPPLQPEG